MGVPDDVVAVKQQLSMVQNRVADWHRRDVPTFVSLSPERTQEVVRGSMFVGSAERFVGKKEEAYSESDKMKVRMVQQVRCHTWCGQPQLYCKFSMLPHGIDATKFLC